MISFQLLQLTQLELIQRVAREVNSWSKLHHVNIVRVFGIVTKFDYTISLITEWVDMGSAIDFVQNHAVDPRPLVSTMQNGHAPEMTKVYLIAY